MCAVSAGHFESVGASSLLSERQKSPAACGSVGGGGIGRFCNSVFPNG